MSSATYEKILGEVLTLSPSEVDQLIEDLLRQKGTAEGHDQPASRWEDLIGLPPCPPIGEDAQDWVKRNRTESEMHRQQP